MVAIQLFEEEQGGIMGIRIGQQVGMGVGQARRLVALEGGAGRQQGRLAPGGLALAGHHHQLLLQFLD